MISLQIALLIAGIVVFLIIAIISYDKLRHTRLHSRKEVGIDYDDDESDEAEPLLTPRATAGDEAPSAAGGYHDEEPAETAGPEPEPAAATAPRQLKPEFLEQDDAAADTDAQTQDPAARNWESQIKDAEELVNTPIDGVPEMKEYGGDEGMQLEYVARIPGKNVIKRDSALGIYRQNEFDLSKPHRIFGLSHPTRMWCDLEKQPETARFTDFGLTLQLADRDGPADESELNQFSQIVLKLSEVFGRRFQFSCGLDDALNQAQYLDGLIRKYDALAILNIVARNDPFQLSDIDAAARELGMAPNPRSVYVKYENDRPVYRLADREKARRDDDGDDDPHRVTRGLTLFMDIPRTLDPARVFNDMVADAKELCKRLDGKLVDDNHRGMTQKGLKRIGQEIRTMATEMEKDGIPPGRERATKLF